MIVVISLPAHKKCAVKQENRYGRERGMIIRREKDENQ